MTSRSSLTTLGIPNTSTAKLLDTYMQIKNCMLQLPQPSNQAKLKMLTLFLDQRVRIVFQDDYNSPYLLEGLHS